MRRTRHLNLLLAPLTEQAPELALPLRAQLATADPSEAFLEQLTRQALWALRQERSFGQALALGMAKLATSREADWHFYQQQVARAAQHGPSQGRIVAATLASVLACGVQGLLDDYLGALAIMAAKGAYLLEGPLNTLARFADEGDGPGASAFAKLLATLFSQELSYQRCRRFAEDLPACALRLGASRRSWQFDALRRLAAVDHRLVEAGIEGLSRGLETLPQAGLEAFIRQGLSTYRSAPHSAAAFFAMHSQQARSLRDRLHPAVALHQVRPALERYLRARIGRTVPIHPLEGAGEKADGQPETAPLRVTADGGALFLPAEIALAESHAENYAIYKRLVRLEAGAWEWGLFGFDLQQACANGQMPDSAAAAQSAGDFERFCAGFDDPELSIDLFTLVEHARQARCLTRCYPGLAAALRKPMAQEIERLLHKRSAAAAYLALYAWSWPGLESLAMALPAAAATTIRTLAEWIGRELAAAPAVEACARLVRAIYPALQPLAVLRPIPFGRRLQPHLYRRRAAGLRHLAHRLQAALSTAGIQSSLGAVLAELVLGGPPQDSEELALLGRRLDGSQTPSAEELQRAWSHWSGAGRVPAEPAAVDGRLVGVFRYPEWDEIGLDYLPDHVWLREQPIATAAADEFYERTLQRYHDLARRVRQAFEHLRPQGLQLMRRWPEGDGLDLDALLEHVVERRVRASASERIYLKHLQHTRDVAVLLLVDLSRSTAMPLSGGTTVLDIEKAAIILFCEALKVVGDRLAIAGFSSNGARAVEYYPIKAFDEPANAVVQGRIGGLQPRRNTRMGAAVRHAARQLAVMPSQARLLLLLSDGYPNDTDYRGARAIEDTARALDEARAQGIHSHGLSVLSQPDRRLDRIYGPTHHSVIADVHELPETLLALYRRLTRH